VVGVKIRRPFLNWGKNGGVWWMAKNKMGETPRLCVVWRTDWAMKQPWHHADSLPFSYFKDHLKWLWFIPTSCRKHCCYIILPRTHSNCTSVTLCYVLLWWNELIIILPFA
jgi:hypothetical protein